MKHDTPLIKLHDCKILFSYVNYANNYVIDCSR